MKKRSFLFALCLSFISAATFAAKVDTVAIPSAAMKKTYKAAIVFPDSYAKSKASFPVLYLLHGAFGHFSDWLNNTPDKMLVKNLADQYNIIVVMPEGEVFGFYLDSPVAWDSQFETYIIKEVIPFVDDKYRTIGNRRGRVISGLSMGGFGSLYLSGRHPELFCAAGSMSGAVDPNTTTWNLDKRTAAAMRSGVERVLGPITYETYLPYSIINMADQLKKNGLKLIIDIGVDDFLLEPNRQLHQRLVYNHTPHDYTERPGGHSWIYWQNSLPYHFLFFSKVFAENKVLKE